MCWESTAIRQVLGHLVTWTRKKSGARLQFCFIQVNGFNPTTMKTVGFLCQGCSISRMQTSQMPRDVDLLRSKAKVWPGVISEERVSPELPRAPLPLLSSFAPTTPVSEQPFRGSPPLPYKTQFSQAGTEALRPVREGPQPRARKNSRARKS